MPKILVLYYSMYGHIETLAGAIAEGARDAGGVDVVIKRVADIIPEEVAKTHGAKLDQAAPIASPKELGDYDAIIFGTPTRFGNMAAQMRNFLDQTGSLWMQGALVGKVGSVFTTLAPAEEMRAPSSPSFPRSSTTAWSMSGCPIRVRNSPIPAR